MKAIVSGSLFATMSTILRRGATGCSTFESRVREKSEVFESLPGREQKRLKRGVLRDGDTEVTVDIALGRPDEKRAVDVADGRRDVRSYRSYWQEFAGTEWISWHRSILPGPRGFVIFHEPVTTDIARTTSNEFASRSKTAAFERGSAPGLQTTAARARSLSLCRNYGGRCCGVLTPADCATNSKS